jgi:hypothetical protein
VLTVDVAELKQFAELAIQELQHAVAMQGGGSTVDNSTTVVRYDGKAMWKEELEQQLELLNERIANAERIVLGNYGQGAATTTGATGATGVAGAAGAAGARATAGGVAKATSSVGAPLHPSSSDSVSMHNFRKGVSETSQDEVLAKMLRSAGEGELIRRLQALERTVQQNFAAQKQSQTAMASSSTQKGGSPSKRTKSDASTFTRLQSQIRDLQTAMALVKRQLVDAGRGQGGGGAQRGRTLNGRGNNAMLLGSRCMACDSPVHVRHSMSVATGQSGGGPHMTHDSFQPYNPIPVADDKRTNHPYPGRTRAMTTSPSADKMLSSSADVRGLQSGGGGGGGHDEHGVPRPKRWYDDEPGAKIAVVDLANPEQVGPILKEGGYRRSNKQNRAGALRGNATTGQQGHLPPI